MRICRPFPFAAVLISILIFAAPGWARDGDFVRTFGGAGREQIGFSPNLGISIGNGYAFTPVAVQPADGKIVIGATLINTASDDFGVLRLNPNGTLDTSFGGGAGGQTLIPFDNGGSNNDYASAMALDVQGNIIIAGTASGVTTAGGSDCAVARLTPAGALDTTFSGDGKTTIAFDLGPAGQRDDSCYALALQSDGKILIAGTAQTGMTSGASPHATSRMAIARLLSNGTRDTSFNGSGLVSINFGPNVFGARAVGLVQQSDGGILLVGGAAYATDPSGVLHMAAARLTSAGALDTNFGNGGILLYDPGINGYATGELTNVVTFPDRSFVATGHILQSNSAANYDFFFARFSASGALDTTFGSSGHTVVPFDLGATGDDIPIALKVDSQGRFIANGFATTTAPGVALMAMARLTPAGNLDNSFGYLGTLAISTAASAATGYGDTGAGLALNADGSLLVTSLAIYDAAGDEKVGIAKLVGDTVFSNGFEF